MYGGLTRLSRPTSPRARWDPKRPRRRLKYRTSSAAGLATRSSYRNVGIRRAQSTFGRRQRRQAQDPPRRHPSRQRHRAVCGDRLFDLRVVVGVPLGTGNKDREALG